MKIDTPLIRWKKEKKLTWINIQEKFVINGETLTLYRLKKIFYNEIQVDRRLTGHLKKFFGLIDWHRYGLESFYNRGA